MTQNSGEATIGLSGTTATALWAGRVMTGLFVLFMLFDVGIKLMRLPIVDDAMIQLGYPPGLGFRSACSRLCCCLYLVPRTAILGAVLFTGVFGGAIASHMRIGDPLFSHVLFGVYLGGFAWGGLWFRDASLRALLPVRR